jgi:hypothetical protein
MQPISGRVIRPSASAPRPSRAPGRAPAAQARADEVQVAPVPPRLVELLGRVPTGAARTDRLLGPPPSMVRGAPAAGRFAAVSAALRSVASRTQRAGRAEDPLLGAAAALPPGAALRAAIECEQRLGAVVAELCGLRDQVAAGIAAVTVG